MDVDIVWTPGDKYFDEWTSTKNRVEATETHFHVTYYGTRPGYIDKFSGVLTLEKLTTEQVIKGSFELNSVNGTFICSYSMRGAFRDETYGEFLGEWIEEDDQKYKFELYGLDGKPNG